jgi:hypothetical protein
VPRIVTAILTSCLVVACGLALSSFANADDVPPFRRTTPRASLAQIDGALVIGVPGGRAWGIESELRTLPPEQTTIVVKLGVHDQAVRHAFVRVAYYAKATGRTRQLAIADSAPVAAGTQATVAVPIEPPDGAVAYRVRVLARLHDAGARSSDAAVTAVLRLARGAARPFGSLASRLLE